MVPPPMVLAHLLYSLLLLICYLLRSTTSWSMLCPAAMSRRRYVIAFVYRRLRWWQRVISMLCVAVPSVEKREVVPARVRVRRTRR